MKRILISPKIIKDKYGQLGQFLDLSWSKFFKRKVEILSWTPNKIYQNNLNFNGLILSGGNDLYKVKKMRENLIRDEIESKLLEFALKRSIPILAVCRGFQFANDFFGGSLTKIKNHSNKNHKIDIKKNFLFLDSGKILKTNSFHNYKIQNLAKNFEIISMSKDNSIEIAYAKKEKILGLMFHPERKNLSQLIINKLIFKYFRIK